MKSTSLLIVGDSFSTNNAGWPAHLNYNVTNLSSNGSSEYRIYKKLKNTPLKKFNKILVCHTSPNRIYIDYNPIHSKSLTHQTCDLIYSDVANNHSDFAKNVKWWFENVYDIEQAKFVHQLMIEEIQNLTKSIPTTHITFFDYNIENIISFYDIWKSNPGHINHLSQIGNEIVYNRLKDIL